MALDTETEQLDEHKNTKRYAQAKDNSYQQDNGALRANLTHGQWLIDKLTLIGCSCQRDTVLLALLQQQQVKT